MSDPVTVEKYAMGQSVHRLEDPHLLQGLGRYSDDVNLPRQVYAVVVRSVHAHARLRGIDASAALKAPGALAVLTGDDFAADGLGNLPTDSNRKRRDGSPAFTTPRPALIRGRVRHVGDPLALVVAETPEQAVDAAALVAVDYEPLPAVAEAVEARRPGAPAVWEEAPDNVAFVWEVGSRDAVARAFEGAAHVTRLDFVVSRVAAAPLEPRGGVGEFDRRSGRYTLYTGIQAPHGLRTLLAEQVFRVPQSAVRVVTGEVGGSFGMRSGIYPEMVLVLWAAKRLGRPVKWTSDRREGFVTDEHGRDNVTSVELALDAGGKFLALGLANPIEVAGGPYTGVNPDTAEMRVNPDGSVSLFAGSTSMGQGNQTAFAQIVSDKLGLSPERIQVFWGDSDLLGAGRGNGGSGALTVGGSAVLRATEKVIERGRRIAAKLLEAAHEDVVLRDGRFTVTGTDRGVTFNNVARAAYQPRQLPPGFEPGFSETAAFVPPAVTFPNGCHLCEVEIDEETGAVRVVRYAVVDDVGRMVNPMLVKGQIHGGIVQGLGQGLFEILAYDSGTGQLLSGSFMDYAMPRADDLPFFDVDSHEVPTKVNPLGAKGVGEAGTVGAMPALLNAVNDALAPLGVRHLDMPVTPERVWRAIREAKRPGRP